MAAVAAPVMGPLSDAMVMSFGEGIIVKVGLHVGFELGTKVANDLVFDKTLKHAIPIHSDKLETTAVKTLLITLKFKHTTEDAALGFYRSSVHQDSSLFASVKDYLSVEKGWFSPYLFASGRRPAIPRSMKPDIIFCHAPFLIGDYSIGETLLAESAWVFPFATRSTPSSNAKIEEEDFNLSLPSLSLPSLPKLSRLGDVFSHSRTPSPEPALAPAPPVVVPRRMVILIVGIKPHRKLWTTSARPSESVMNYLLLNGCPAVVVPVKTGSPLIAWDTLTLEHLCDIELPEVSNVPSKSGQFEGIVNVLLEYLDFCVDWERFELPGEIENQGGELGKCKATLKAALQMAVSAAVRSGASQAVKDEVDADRAGIAMWRIP
ncbi:hypothetical protein ONZ45_g16608 [Pleurotus djamor]|nr:hypothetical protein ONZ45_g16608 [Pleurotus djamor]